MIATIRCQDLKLVGNKQHVYKILRFFKRFTLKINKRKFHFFTSFSGLRPLAADGQYILSYDVCLSQRGRLGEQHSVRHKKIIVIIITTNRKQNDTWTKDYGRYCIFGRSLYYISNKMQENL